MSCGIPELPEGAPEAISTAPVSSGRSDSSKERDVKYLPGAASFGSSSLMLQSQSMYTLVVQGVINGKGLLAVEQHHALMHLHIHQAGWVDDAPLQEKPTKGVACSTMSSDH